jgi:hypothetical protein
MKLESTKDYLKYTLTLAGIGFVYASQGLAGRSELFGEASFLGLPSLPEFGHVRLLVGFMLGLFFLSTLWGIVAFSAIIRYENLTAAAAPGGGATPAFAGESGGTVVASSGASMAMAGPGGSAVFAPSPPSAAAANPRAERALRAANRRASDHLVALILGFLRAAVFFLDAFARPVAEPQRCTLALPPAAAGTPGVVLSFDCKPEVAAAAVAAGGTATAPQGGTP